MIPPKAALKIQKKTTHGILRSDEYAWLREGSDAKVRAYISAENKYADWYMRPTQKLQKKLCSEIRKRMKENDMSVPVKDGPYYYYSRMQKGKQYAIHCRRRGERGKEEIILDENALAKGEKYFSLDQAEVSPDHALLAYTVDVNGSERFRLRIKDLKSGKLLSEDIDEVGNIVWAEDGQHLLYTQELHPFPARKVFIHTIGTPSIGDKLIYEEKDEQWYVGIGKTTSKKFLIIYGGTFDTSEVQIIPADKPLSRPIVLSPRKKEVRYTVEHQGDYLYIVTNENAINFKVMRTPIDSPEKRHWRAWIAHDPSRSITGLLAFQKFMALTARVGGSEELFVHEPGNSHGKKVVLPEGEHSIMVHGDLEHASPFVRLTYSSAITPRTVFDYHALKKKLIARKRQEVPTWNKKGYVSKRIWIKNGDVKIPVILAYKKHKILGPRPLLLEAYGAYGISSDPYFSIAKISLMERGWIMAKAHPRGGGEMGWQWHKAAKLRTKHRTYEDVIAVADDLVKKKYTSRDKIALVGGSAGGMMVGAVLNMRPDLVQAAISYVPAADTVTSMMDPTLAGTRLHYDEMGNPSDPKMYKYLMKYSPYENVKKKTYPSLLVRSNMNDIRTPYWEAAKWVARLRARKVDNNALLLKTETVAGHFGKSGRYEWIKESAFDYAFLIEMVEKREPPRRTAGA